MESLISNYDKNNETMWRKQDLEHRLQERQWRIDDLAREREWRLLDIRVERIHVQPPHALGAIIHDLMRVLCVEKT